MDKDFLDAIETYKHDHVLSQDKIIDHLNETLGTDVINASEFIQKYKGNKEMANAAKEELQKLEEHYKSEGNLTGSDFWEDEDFYYIKNFKELPWAPNVSWTQHGDLDIPGLGILGPVTSLIFGLSPPP